MGLLKKLFGNNARELEEKRLEEERQLAEKRILEAEEARKKSGFYARIPEASEEWLKSQTIQMLESQNMEYVFKNEHLINFKGSLRSDLNGYSMSFRFAPNGISIYALPAPLLNIPSEREAALVELLTRINERIVEVYFTYHRDINCIACKTFLVNNGEETTAETILKSVLAIVAALNGYGNCIVKTINGIGTPATNEARASELLFL